MSAGLRQRAGGRAAVGALAVALLLGAGPAPAPRALVLPEPGTTVAALVVDVASDAATAALAPGALRLAGESALESVRPELEALGARTTLECSRAGVRVVLLAPPSAWQRAAARLLDGLFHPVLQPGALARARDRVVRSLAFSRGDPTAEVRRLSEEALFGPGAPDACGDAADIDSLTTAQVRAAALQFSAGHAAAALVGPVTAEDARALLDRYFAAAPPAAPPTAPATIAGSRAVESETVTDWLVLAFPLPAYPDDEAVRLLAHQLARTLRPSPDRPDVVDADARVQRVGSRGALVVYLATEPGAIRRWATQVRALVDAAAAEPLDGNAFGLLLRRYRGDRLRALDTPEARAADAADRLLQDRSYVAPEARIDALTPERLRAAAADLGAPASAFLGPAGEGTAALERRVPRQ